MAGTTERRTARLGAALGRLAGARGVRDGAETARGLRRWLPQRSALDTRLAPLLAGFVIGAVFWHFVGFWHFVSSVFYAGPDVAYSRPSGEEITTGSIERIPAGQAVQTREPSTFNTGTCVEGRLNRARGSVELGPCNPFAERLQDDHAAGREDRRAPISALPLHGRRDAAPTNPLSGHYPGNSAAILGE